MTLIRSITLISCAALVIVGLSLFEKGRDRKSTYSTRETLSCAQLFGQVGSTVDILATVSKLDFEVNNRKWVKNYLGIDRAYIGEKSKKRYKAVVTIHSNLGKCATEARIRVSGRGYDHIDKSAALTSLDVSLDDDAIGHVTRFKLFLSGTRGLKSYPKKERDDLELLMASLIRLSGGLAPLTRTLEFGINGQYIEGIFQEKPEKEFLESFGRREGPIVFYDSDTEEITPLYKKGPGHNPDLGLVKIANDAWLKKSDAAYESGIVAYAVGAREILEQKQRFFMKGALVTDNISAHRGSSLTHDLISVAMGSWHNLYHYNRRYYWDSIRQQLEAIYYDGSPLNLVDMQTSVKSTLAKYKAYILGKYSQNDVIAAIQNLESIDDELLYNELRILGFSQGMEYVSSYLNVLKANLRVVQDSVGRPEDLQNFDIDTAQKTFHKDVTKFWPADRLKFFYLRQGVSGNQLELCHTKECDIEVSPAEGIKLLRSSVSKNGEINYALQLGELLTGRHFVESEETSFPTIEIIGNVVVSFDEDKKQVSVYGVDHENKIVVIDSDLTDIDFHVIGSDSYYTSPKDFSTPAMRADNRGLTGCITFIDSSFSATKMHLSNLNCEDGVNFIRSTGGVDSLTVKHSSSDAIDLDFSDMTFDSVDIQSAGNDCIDVSGGYYVFRKLRLVDCGDKGISVGENSNAQVSTIVASSVDFGIVAKDSSMVTLGAITVTECGTALAAYRKKQEFGGGQIIYDSLTSDCAKKEQIDGLSKILSTN